MRILVTGSTGFLGRAFVTAAVEAGHEVVAQMRRRSSLLDGLRIETVLCDVRDLDRVELPGDLDALVNFATGSEGDADSMAGVAVDGVAAAYATARTCAIRRLVHVSSMSVYPGPVVADPATPGGRALEPRPDLRGSYARSKVLAEQRLHELVRNAPGGPEVVIVRPGLVYGTDMKDPLAGQIVRLPLGVLVGFGRPHQGVPFLDLDDLVNGILGTVRSPADGGGVRVIDLLSGAPPPRREVVRLYRELSGQDGPSLWVPRALALAGASLVDALRLRPAAPRRATSYAVRRVYDFDPAALPWERSSKEAAVSPRGDVRGAIRAALTLDRHPPAQGRVFAPARDLLRIAADESTPTGASAPVALLLVGAGTNLADLHLPTIASIDGYRIRAIVDPVPARRCAIAGRLGDVRVHSDVAELEDDLVSGATAVICTPGATHAELGCDLLRRGADLLVEKPVAVTTEEFVRLEALQAETARRVTVVQNYRLRPAAVGLWRFLSAHDVGSPVSIRVVFHSRRIVLESARWMHEERCHRALLLEMAIHFIDLACLVGGPLVELHRLSTVRRAGAGSTVSVRGAGSLAGCREFELDLDLAGTAPRVRLELEFERAACVLDFYPDGFRVLSRVPNPIDDIAAAAMRLRGAVLGRVRPAPRRAVLRARPHRAIYLEHLRRLAGAAPGPFALSGVKDTMTTLYRLTDAVYADGS